MAKVLAARGAIDELATLAAAGNWLAKDQLIEARAARGELEEVQLWAADGEWLARDHLIRTFLERGDLDELRGRADADEDGARSELADLLAAAAGSRSSGDEQNKVIVSRPAAFPMP